MGALALLSDILKPWTTGGSGPPVVPGQVKINAGDASANYLDQKIVAGANIEIDQIDTGGGNLELSIKNVVVPPTFQDVPIAIGAQTFAANSVTQVDQKTFNLSGAAFFGVTLMSNAGGLDWTRLTYSLGITTNGTTVTVKVLIANPTGAGETVLANSSYFLRFVTG